MPILLGLLAGVGLPVQTSVNTRLRERVGSPYGASLVSFLVGLLFLVVLSLATGQGVQIPFARVGREPLWIWTGGICGVIFLTGNIVLFTKLGGVQTVVLPVLGQILMGLIVDDLGAFRAQVTPLSATRIAGAALVLLGVVLVSLAKAGRTAGDGSARAEHASLWLWRALGVCTGALSAAQTAINGYLGQVLGAPVKASIVSFLVGSLCLAVLCLVRRLRNGRTAPAARTAGNGPWWMWIGGALGGTYVLATVYLSRILGTGMTVIVLLIGSTAGGILVDRFGLFGAPRKPVGRRKLLGVLLMILGAAAIRLL